MLKSTNCAATSGRKTNKQWLWLALDAQSRQVVAFHIGNRSKRSARKLWKKIPAVYREQAIFWTDGYASYPGCDPCGTTSGRDQSLA